LTATDALSRPLTTLEELRAGGFELETRAGDEHLDTATFHA